MIRRVLSVAVSLAILNTVAQEAAQSVSPEKPIRLEMITVEGNQLYSVLPSESSRDYTMEAATVGTKIPASLRDIPQSVSIVTQQAIKERNVQTFDQLAAKTPGLRVLANDDGRSSVYARGYEYDEYNIDGLPAQMQSINGTLPNLAAFDRVEIMRGPSGLFDSSGEMGGIVNFVRKRPSDVFKGSASVGVGTLKQYHLGTDVGGPLNSDASIRGRALIDANGKTPKVSDKNNRSEVLYGALDFDLGEQTILGAGYLFQQRHLKPDNGLPTLGANKTLPSLPDNTFYGANWNKFAMQSNDVFADLKHEFNNGGYGQVGMRYSDRDSDMNYAFSRSAVKGDGTFDGAGLGANVKQKAFALDASYSQPFEAWGNVSEYVVGADFNHMTTRTQRGRAMFKGLTVSKLNNLPYRDLLSAAKQNGKGFSDQETELNDFGIYGKLTLRPIQPLAVIAGGRLSNWSIEAKNNVNGQSNSRDEKARFTGYGGVVFDLDDNHSIYASYSSLYAPQDDIGSDGNLLKARQGQQYEAGIKGSYYGDKLQTRLSVFRLDDKNAAAPVVSQNYSAAIGKRKVKGIEAEINGEVAPNWQVSAGYTYMKTDIDREKDSQETFFLLMPKHIGTLWSSYRENDHLTVGGGINAMSGFESIQGVKASGYATVDAMVSYDINDNLHAQFNVNNLLDRDYYKRVGSPGTFNMPGEERTFNASLRYDF
ncbi:TonB-dependent siderophore receptor [Cardiobacteriaceae bacterium TAE3-ERU3]|nr:TonB-dependent siderophore receptor [Cardiobacteriaceae bacterium TAE3-ERU3]